MLTLLLGPDWTANREAVLNRIATDVRNEKQNRILMVPELISHDTERRLCAAAGDTASRFAEVLSFSRLARRVADEVGHGLDTCLDDGGRVVAMAAAARQLHSRLKAYAAVETRPEFLTGLVDAIDEFKRCCITPKDLNVAAFQTEGSLAQKLEELALLYETYDSLCQLGKRDPRDQMTWLLEQLEDSDFAQNHTFYIDGFPDFTRQHMAILEHLIVNAPEVVISMNCDVPNSRKIAFEKAGETTAQLIRCADRAGISTEIVNIPAATTALRPLRDKLFQGRIEEKLPQLFVYQTDSVYTECLLAAERVLKLVHSGARYRDISVVCTDMAVYQNAVSTVFQRCRIPHYISGTEDILEKSVIRTVLSAIDAALSGFEQRDVFRYMKSILSPVDQQTSDLMENYAVIWNIQGTQWQKEWTNHPAGLGEPWSEQAYCTLNSLNSARQQMIEPLVRLRKNFLAGKCLREQVLALYRFLEDIALSARLYDLSQEMDSEGDNADAQILDQLWEILLSALEQLYDMLGDTVWDAETFVRLLKLLLSQYTVGTIPPVLDAVMAGPVSAMRCQQQKHLIVLGALEGSLPGYAGISGVLSDQERTLLREMGVPLTGGAMDGLQVEFSEIYGVFCGAEETVCISCPSGQPSHLYRRMSSLSGGEQPHIEDALGAAQADAYEAAALLSRYNAKDVADALMLTDTYTVMESCKQHVLGTVMPQTVTQLYGHKLNLSASQVDTLANCRLSYFLKYGLKARERKAISVDPAEFGTYVHAVLENTARDIMQMGGFHQVSLQQTLEIAGKHSAAYCAERFSQIESERLSYLFRRNGQELSMVVEELWQELREAAFTPCGFEIGFGDGEEMEPISIPDCMLDAQLRGFVDRVDVWQEDGRNYFRVVDYKTGKKDFDYCDVFNGLGLQMLLYLFALQEAGEQLLGKHAVPAGVQYFPARAPLVSADGVLTPTEAAEAREKMWKRKGMLLNDEEVLAAMEPGAEPKRLSYVRKKDGSISGDLADREQFALLKSYIFRLLGHLVDEIASGKLQPNPYTRGTSHNACTYCPYGAVCHPEHVAERRNYKTMTAQRFWEEVEKEMKKHG